VVPFESSLREALSDDMENFLERSGVRGFNEIKSVNMFVMRMGMNRRPMGSIVPSHSELLTGVLPVIRIFSVLAFKNMFSDMQSAAVIEMHGEF